MWQKANCWPDFAMTIHKASDLDSPLLWQTAMLLTRLAFAVTRPTFTMANSIAPKQILPLLWQVAKHLAFIVCLQNLWIL